MNRIFLSLLIALLPALLPAQAEPFAPAAPANRQPRAAQSAPAEAAQNFSAPFNAGRLEAGVQESREGGLSPSASRNPASPAPSGGDDALLESLKMNSPFGGAAAGLAGAGKPAESMQISSVKLQSAVCLNGKWFFSISDEKLKKSEWMAVGETKLGCTINSYDEQTGALNVSIDSQQYPIFLKERDPLKSPAQPQPRRGRGGNPMQRFINLPPEKRREFLQNALKGIDREIAAKKAREARADSENRNGR
ncbi:MAG: hypothetical protein J6P03_07940 [Opitutales bacterium]|nr:hypothetical protein [Opitutales bacterium]